MPEQRAALVPEEENTVFIPANARSSLRKPEHGSTPNVCLNVSKNPKVGSILPALLVGSLEMHAPRPHKQEQDPSNIVVPSVLGGLLLLALIYWGGMHTRQPPVHRPQPQAATPVVATEVRAPERITAQHLLVMYAGSTRSSQTRSREEARARAEEALRRLQAHEPFDRIVCEFSDEPGGCNRHGSLGSFSRGMMVPRFEEAAFALSVGQLSQVIETDFGFHVILRNE